ncbi:GlxA family transcriptional regulator [Nonomuraea sp. NPDC050783]|uniref:GlxA family transcriptional regulator n=1 Tax=Nonomuraea sp. NPDC050783 TaxID=3154634 RepID=UPI003467928D
MTGFRRVVAYATDGVSAFGLGAIGKVFADRSRQGLPEFAFTVCAERPARLSTDLGLTVTVDQGLDALHHADLVVLLPREESRPAPPPAVADALRAAHARGAVLAAFCTGTFLLAGTGLLDGRRATTHWSLAAELAARHPTVTVDATALYVDEGSLVTGAGAAAGLDMCLHLLRREHGAAVANAIARELVVPPHRPGDQAQYITRPLPQPDDERLGTVIAWARANLDRPLPVEEMAATALMSPRSFARRFKALTGTTPHAWLLTQRLDRAEELLETTDLSMEQIARLVGYRSAAVLRDRFTKRRGVPPRLYRQAFRRAG